MRDRRHTTLWRLIALGLTLMLTAAACSGQDQSTEAFDDSDGGGFGFDAAPTTVAADAADEERGVVGGEAEPPSDDGGDLGSGGVTPAVFDTTTIGRDIIFTADLTVAVRDVAVAGDEATRAIQGLGGFLFGQRTQGSPEPVSVLVFKVLPEDFQEALSRLGDIGDLRNQNVTADDVTERVVDLQSRINTAEASVERLRTFLENATNVQTIADLENQLLQRETQLETLRGQLRTIQDQVALATITLTLVEAASRPGVRVDVTAYPGHEDQGASCPGSPSLVVDKGSDLTVCFEIFNTGDTDLRGFTLRDRLLDLELDDLIVVFGDPSDTIVPGESIVLAAEISIDRTVRTQTNVTAIPVDEDGNGIPGRSVANTNSIFLQAVDPEGIPGFTAGVRATWNVLVTLGQVLVLMAGVLIPLIPLLLIAWFGWRAYRRRNPKRPPLEAPTLRQPVPTGAPADEKAESAEERSDE